jgi:hypothetical protein
MKLDYSLFPAMESGYFIMPTPDERLRDFSELYDRFCSAIYMASKISDDSSKSMLSNKAHSSGYTRAALAEFAGIDEFIEQNLKQLKREDYTIYKQPNPLFHIMKILRNYNVHVGESTLSEKAMKVALPSKPQEAFEISIRYINNLSADKLKQLKSTKDYSKAEIEKMIVHFDNAQREFGVSALLIRGVILYSSVISCLLVSC